MTDLREALFDTLEKFRKDEIGIDKAKQICSIAQTLINTANAETNFVRAIDSRNGTGFMEIENSYGKMD